MNQKRPLVTDVVTNEEAERWQTDITDEWRPPGMPDVVVGRLLATRAALMEALETVLGLGDYATAEYAAGIRESARALLAELHGEKP